MDRAQCLGRVQGTDPLHHLTRFAVRILFALLFIASVTACKQVSVTHVPSMGASDKNDRGIYYYLPRTDLVVQVEVTRTTKTAGDLAAEAQLKKYYEPLNFDPKKCITAASQACAVKSASLRSIPSIDSAQIYRLSVPRRFLQSNNITAEYAENGELKSGKSSFEDHTFQLITQTINTVSAFAQAAAGRGEEVADPFKDDTTPAGKAAAAILEIRRAKYGLLIGTPTGANKDALAYKIDELDKQEQALLARFTGTVKKETATLGILVDPARAELDPTKGLDILKVYSDGVEQQVTNDRLARVDDLDSQKKAGAFETISIRWAAKAANMGLGTVAAGAVPKCALVYRVPANMTGVVKGTGTQNGAAYTKVYCAQDVQVPQLGAVGFLPKLNEMEFALHPGLGSLKSLVGATKSLDPENVKTLTDATLGLDTAFKASPAADPRDKQIADLEKEVKIKELLDKLNGTPEVEE